MTRPTQPQINGLEFCFDLEMWGKNAHTQCHNYIMSNQELSNYLPVLTLINYGAKKLIMDGGQTNVSYFRSCQKWVGLIGLWCFDTGPKPFKEKLSCRGWMSIVDVLLRMCAHVCRCSPLSDVTYQYWFTQWLIMLMANSDLPHVIQFPSSLIHSLNIFGRSHYGTKKLIHIQFIMAVGSAAYRTYRTRGWSCNGRGSWGLCVCVCGWGV